MLAEYIIAKYDSATGNLADFREVLTSEAGIDEVHVDRLHALIQTLTVRRPCPSALGCHPRQSQHKSLSRACIHVMSASTNLDVCGVQADGTRRCRQPSRPRGRL